MSGTPDLKRLTIRPPAPTLVCRQSAATPLTLQMVLLGYLLGESASSSSQRS